MSRVLLADDSPHAQRMGERILREEGFEVVTVTDGDTALIRIPDVDPDVVMADIFLPQKSGYQICELVKTNAKYRHVRVILLAGSLEPVDEAEVRRVNADAVLKKPLEASVVISTVKALIENAKSDRKAVKPPAVRAPAEAPRAGRITGSILGLSLASSMPATAPAAVAEAPKAAAQAEQRPARLPEKGEIDPEMVHAAITVALDRAMPALIEEIAGRVMEALRR
jgi:DNA-binding response OmpR family regulator